MARKKVTPVRLRVRELRKAMKLTQDQLADLSGVDQGNISKLERGETKGVDFRTLEKLADALGVDAGFLIVHERDTTTKKKR